MKKFFWLILFLIPISCFSLNYTNYGNYKYSFDEVKASDLIEVKKEKLYKFYTNKKIYGGYYRKGDNPKEYPYQSNKTKLSDFSNYQEEKVEARDNRIIEEKKEIYYQKLKGIRYVTLKYFSSKNSTDFHIKDIKVLYDDELLDYTYTDDKNLKRNEDNRFGLYSLYKSFITLDLGSSYDVDLLKIQIIFYGKKDTSIFYDICFNYDVESYYSYISTRVESTYKLEFIQDIIINDNMQINKEYVDTDIYKDHFSYQINTKTLYRYQDLLFEYYKISKVYLKGYYLEKDNYIKDENKFIYRYKYRKRELIEEKIVETKKEDKPKSDYSRQILFGMIPLALSSLGYFLYKLIKDKGD